MGTRGRRWWYYAVMPNPRQRISDAAPRRATAVASWKRRQELAAGMLALAANRDRARRSGRRLAESVADPANGLDQPAGVAQLLPQRLDVHVDGPLQHDR